MVLYELSQGFYKKFQQKLEGGKCEVRLSQKLSVYKRELKDFMKQYGFSWYECRLILVLGGGAFCGKRAFSVADLIGKMHYHPMCQGKMFTYFVSKNSRVYRDDWVWIASKEMPQEKTHIRDHSGDFWCFHSFSHTEVILQGYGFYRLFKSFFPHVGVSETFMEKFEITSRPYANFLDFRSDLQKIFAIKQYYEEMFSSVSAFSLEEPWYTREIFLKFFRTLIENILNPSTYLFSTLTQKKHTAYNKLYERMKKMVEQNSFSVDFVFIIFLYFGLVLWDSSPLCRTSMNQCLNDVDFNVFTLLKRVSITDKEMFEAFSLFLDSWLVKDNWILIENKVFLNDVSYSIESMEVHVNKQQFAQLLMPHFDEEVQFNSQSQNPWDDQDEENDEEDEEENDFFEKACFYAKFMRKEGMEFSCDDDSFDEEDEEDGDEDNEKDEDDACFLKDEEENIFSSTENKEDGDSELFQKKLYEYKKPTLTFDKLILDEEIKEELRYAVDATKATNWLKEWGIKPTLNHPDFYSAKILLYGLSGTGKTLTAEALAGECGADLFQVDSSALVDSLVGQSLKNVQTVFKQYYALCEKSNKPLFFFINEADQLLMKRGSVYSAADKEYNAMQNLLLQEIEQLRGVLIATTNLIDLLDEAWNRRFTIKVRFDMPSYDIRLKIWKLHINPKVPLAKDVDIAALARYELTGGSIANVVYNAARRTACKPENQRVITQQDFLEAIEQELATTLGGVPKKIGFCS